MSLFSRRYGSNKIKCDFYIVEDTPLITDTSATGNSVYYMYNPDEWLVRIKNLFHGKLPQPTDPEMKKLSIVAYAIVTDKYQFLFSPTLAFSETINTLIWDRTSSYYATYYGALSTNFNAQYIQGSINDLQTLINTFNSSLSADDGYSNTQILKSLNWEDEPVSINNYPYPATFDDVFNGPYVVSSSVNYVGRDDLPKTHADCLLNMFDRDFDLYPDINEPEDIQEVDTQTVRPLRWGMFTDKKGLHINKGDIYVPAINELKVLLKNLCIAVWDKNRDWFNVAGGRYYNPYGPGSYFLSDCTYHYPSGTAYHGYGYYYREIQTWEALGFAGSSPYWGWWSSTPFQYLLSYDSVKGNRFKANLSFYTPCMYTNISSYDPTIGQTGDDDIWIMPNQNHQYGYWRDGINFGTYTPGYKSPSYTGRSYGGYAVGYYDTFSNTPHEMNFIACARIPDNVEWGAESVGHPELIRYN